MLGKSVSPFVQDKPGSIETDFQINAPSIEDAARDVVEKFVYVSAFDAERYPHLDYF